ncbi:MAG TPA: ThuA domain-containing protein [Pirellulaceae bacterium]|nr:ThuA domain-containing protein [Pirellulaceae bacterium]
MKRTWFVCLSLLAVALLAAVPSLGQADENWLVFEGKEGPGAGKHVVLISGDEEYRSEEALPQLGKILAQQHGFKCTVVFPIDPKTGEISPNVNNNIPGLEALGSADLLVIATRFRNLPDDQMKHIADYLKTGKPVIGLRTATHAFNGGGTYGKFSWNNKEWPGGFGKQILGETWVAHHGGHGSESTRGILVEAAKDHPILKGLKNGDIWGPTDVYTVHLPLPGDSVPLVLGEVVKGMKFDDPKLEGKKNDPMMPVAWTKTYKSESGASGRVFTTTMGAATDLEAVGTRKLLVNAVYWATGLEAKIPAEGCKAELVGEFKPTGFGFNKAQKGKKPVDYK